MDKTHYVRRSPFLEAFNLSRKLSCLQAGAFIFASRNNYTAISDSKYIAKGMQVALDKQWINSNTPLWERLTKLVELRRTGEELTIAATNTGVSMKLVEKLMLMGGKRLF